MDDDLEETRKWAAEVLNSLPFVRWDRLVADEGMLRVYGWIDRDDQYQDFILIDFLDTGGFRFVTSAAARHEDILAGLYGSADVGGETCRRVEDVFPDMVPTAIVSTSRVSAAGGSNGGEALTDEQAERIEQIVEVALADHDQVGEVREPS